MVIDKGIIDGIRNGDLKSFDELYNNYSSSLLSFAYNFIKDRNAVQDIVQDSFMALWQQRKKLSDGVDLQNYIFTIVRNKSVNVIRNIIKQRQTSIDELTPKDYFYHRKLITLEQMDSSVIDFENIKSNIDKILSSVPHIYREVFIMSRDCNMSNNEIASELNISVKAVEKRMTKILKIFKKELDNNYIFIFFV